MVYDKFQMVLPMGHVKLLMVYKRRDQMFQMRRHRLRFSQNNNELEMCHLHSLLCHYE
jgi:hypothetical protein